MATKRQSIIGAGGVPSGSGLNRLPTLSEVLMRKTRPPLDLFCFYIFLQQENAEDTLDFWLDVQQHENMCRAYFKDIRKSGQHISQVWPEWYNHARTHGSIFSLHAGVNVDEPPPLADGSQRRVEPGVQVPGGSPWIEKVDEHGRYASSAEHDEKFATHPPRTPSTTHSPPISPNPASSFQSISPRAAQTTFADNPPRGPSRASYGGSIFGKRRVSKAPTIIPRYQAIKQEDLVNSAERIFARYLVQGAEKEIYLPPALRIHDFPSLPSPSHPADPRIPEYFHPAKNYIFKCLEEDAFPRFLRAKAFSNLTKFGGAISLVLGLFALWAGFVVAFTLVFLDYKPKIRRLYLIIPFFIAFYLLFSAHYLLSPILVLFRRSETRPFDLIRVRETYVQKLLTGRALTVMLWTILATAIMVIIWYFVPGKRL